jgi:hypothetical protein
LSRLVVYITDANVREMQTGGKAEAVQRKASEFRWLVASKDKTENLSDKPFEAVIVEFKN